MEYLTEAQQKRIIRNQQICKMFSQVLANEGPRDHYEDKGERQVRVDVGSHFPQHPPPCRTSQTDCIMIATPPNVQPDALYESRQATAILRISRNTLNRYTKAGICKSSYRRSNGRQVWKGSELEKCWRVVY